MEKLQLPCCLILGIFMSLLVYSTGHPNPVFTLYCQNMSLKVKNSQVGLAMGTPTIHGLMVVTHYTSNNISKNNATNNGVITVEAIATGRHLCMNGKGRLYTVELKRSKKRGRRQRHNKSPDVPKNCIFEQQQSDSRVIYRDARGIYSHAHSNETVRLYLSFSSDGKIKGVPRSYDPINSKEDKWVKLELSKINNKDRNLALNRTRFSKDTKFNSRVRKCIRREIPTLFPNHEVPRDSKQNSTKVKMLKKVIPKCKRKVEKNERRNLRRKLLHEEVDINTIMVDGNDGKFKGSMLR